MQNAAPVAEASERRSACAHAVPGGRPMMLALLPVLLGVPAAATAVIFHAPGP